MDDFGLYLVMTAPKAGYARCCEAAVRAGVKMVQLRMKEREWPRDEQLAVARELVSIVRGSATRLIVDDDPALAEEAGADGVHVGQDDLPVEVVRARYPGLALVGLSTHNPAQARAAAAAQPDYIGVGPVFATPTKKTPDPVLGLSAAAEMIGVVTCPAVAIGGIDERNLADVIAAGARNWAVVRAVCGADDPFAAISRLQEAAAAARERTPGGAI